MAEFNILDHIDRLEPDGGKPRANGDLSYVCPKCDGHNFLVNERDGRYLCVNGCTTEEIRSAISPPQKPGSDHGNSGHRVIALRPRQSTANAPQVAPQAPVKPFKVARLPAPHRRTSSAPPGGDKAALRREAVGRRRAKRRQEETHSEVSRS